MLTLKRFLCALLTMCSLPLLAADSTIGNLTPITVVPDAYRMPWENPGVVDYYITFQNLTNQILAGMASQAYAQGLTNNFAYTNWVGANYYPLANPSNFVGSAALSGYALLAGTNLFTATNTFERDAIGTTITPIVYLTNATAAALGAQQVSPALMFGGQGWRSGNSSTMPVQMGMYVLPSQGSSANPIGKLFFIKSISNSVPTDLTGIGTAYIDTIGDCYFNAWYGGSDIRSGGSSYIGFNSRGRLYSPADSTIQLVNAAVTSFDKLYFGPVNLLWPALKVETTNAPTLSIRTGADGNYASLVTSNHIISVTNYGTSIIPALVLTNSTDAALGSQQASPALMFGGQGWRSGNSTTMPVQMGMYVLPAQGSGANPTAQLQFLVSISNAAPTSTTAYISSSGGIGTAGNMAGNQMYCGSGGFFQVTSRSLLASPADSDFQFLNSGSTAFSRLYLGPATLNWPAIKVESSTNNPSISIRTGADGNYASLVASNVTASGFMAPTNGVVMMVKPNFTTNFTCTTNLQTYCCNGTNQLVTLPNAASVPNVIYRFTSTNGYGNFTLTNATGAQTIRDGVSLSHKQIGIAPIAVFSDGANWWLAAKDQQVQPNAQFSCSTNIPLTLASTAYPVTFNSTDFNNSQGIALLAGTNGLLSKMWITNSGEYEFTPSIVINFGGNNTVTTWFKSNGTNIPNSATAIRGAAGGSVRCVTIPFLVSVSEPTAFEIWCLSSNTGDSLVVQAAGGVAPNDYPLSPSVICPVKKISDPFP